MKRFSLILLSAFVIAGCASQEIMPPVKYSAPIAVHLDKQAIITWQPGEETITASPSSYIKAEKSIFLTSLRDILKLNKEFKKVEIKPSVTKLKNNQVDINLNFKRSRIGDAPYNNRIKLSVTLTINDKLKPKFTRDYFVYSTNASKNYLQAQSEVSQELMKYVIAGIKKWSNSN